MKSPAESSFCAYGEFFSISIGFLVGGRFFFRNVLESEIAIGAFVREEHAIVEGILAAQVVSENDVSQFVGQHHGQAAFVGKYVDQAAADDDRVAHAESFQRRGRSARASEPDAAVRCCW